MEALQKTVERRHRACWGSVRTYTDAEVEFIKAMERYRREQRRPLPTFREAFRVALALGYRRCGAPDAGTGGER